MRQPSGAASKSLDTMTLAQLHEVLQIVMGWENYHLHEFTIHGKHYGNPEFEEDPKRKFYDEQAVKLKEVVAGKPGTRLRYLSMILGIADTTICWSKAFFWPIL